MLRNFVRRSSTQVPKGMPYEPVPINTYNQTRSAFNIKPKRTQGIVYNPPASINKPSIKTAKAFLPNDDPRKTLISGGVTYSKEDLSKYPIINSYNAPQDRTYEVTPEIVREIIDLRRADPKEWTISKLSKKFNIPAKKINVFSGVADKVDSLENVTDKQRVKMEDRKKRAVLWLSGEY